MATDPAGDELAEKALQAAIEHAYLTHGDTYRIDKEEMQAALAAVTPLIRAQAFTEAAAAIEALEDGSTEPFVLTEKAAALVRGLGEETASVDSKINKA